MSTTPAQLALTDATAADDSPLLVEAIDATAPADSEPAQGTTEYDFFVPEDAYDGLDEARAGLLAVGESADLVGALLLRGDNRHTGTPAGASSRGGLGSPLACLWIGLRRVLLR